MKSKNNRRLLRGEIDKFKWPDLGITGEALFIYDI